MVPERNAQLWWLGLCPNHHSCGSLLRARGSFVTLLVSRSGSSMRKSFALCECLRPHPLPPLRREAAVDTAVSGGEALRSLHCPARSAVQVSLRAAPHGEDLKEAGGRRPPASFKSLPLPRLDSLLGPLTRAGGGVRGGGRGRPRPLGMLPWCGREAARRDHQPQLVYELMARDTRRAQPPVWWRWPCSFRSRRAGVSEWPEPVVSPAPSLQRPTRPAPVRLQCRFFPRQAREC